MHDKPETVNASKTEVTENPPKIWLSSLFGERLRRPGLTAGVNLRLDNDDCRRHSFGSATRPQPSAALATDVQK
ncbi:hypothetical protein EVAR_30528_1 [Eumeta japonica]|uniref:Uncharacterized protein n=1 Tax=Eumeta variegata TaxID=151549 RepID=A0A4C1W0M5_EUMVA|nr:hypothetical protein EVAR_30528_1 [Eumeta japonica]